MPGPAVRRGSSRASVCRDGLAAGVAERAEDSFSSPARVRQQLERLVGVGGDDDRVVVASNVAGGVLHRDARWRGAARSTPRDRPARGAAGRRSLRRRSASRRHGVPLRRAVQLSRPWWSRNRKR